MATIIPPSSYLPPIAQIATCTPARLLDALTYLKLLYSPEVRGARRIRTAPEHFQDHSASETKSHSSVVQLIRSDAFERSWAIRWLTALISQMDSVQDLSSSTCDAQADPTSILRMPAHPEILIQEAASLLAMCAGVSAAGRVQRTFTFESSAAGKIEVHLADIPLENRDYNSVGSQTWGGACVLAEMAVDHPDRFGLRGVASGKHSCLDERELRILELGAGTGLVGLTVAKLLATSSARRTGGATIVMTDFYPPVLANLAANIDRNVTGFPATVTVVSHALDWSTFPAMSPVPQVFSEPFDVVLGADIVYKVEHAAWINSCLKRLLRHPGSGPLETGAVFHLVVPLRRTHKFESSTVETAFRWIGQTSQHGPSEPVILSKETLFCEAPRDTGMGRGCEDVVEYAHYRIGWR